MRVEFAIPSPTVICTFSGASSSPMGEGGAWIAKFGVAGETGGNEAQALGERARGEIVQTKFYFSPY